MPAPDDLSDAFISISADGSGRRVAASPQSIERLERAGDYDRAFAEMAVRNAGTASPATLGGLEAAHKEFVARITAQPAAAWQGRSGNGSSKPIFVVGMPRSGSTLVEQILDTHPRVQGFGETEALDGLLAGRSDWADPANLAVGALRQLSVAYLNDIRARGWNGAAKFTDKTLPNYLNIGLISLMFPNATILHCVRDPIDTCFSGFRSSFGLSSSTWFTRDLPMLGRYYRRYRAVMDYWARVLPGRVIDIDHEALVADVEQGARASVAACRLEWDPRCLKFYENPREVFSASREQVRRPIFTESLGRWAHYRDHLGPLLEALGPYAPKGV